MLKKTFFLSVWAMFLLPLVTSMAAPSTVPNDARTTAEMVKEEAKAIAEQARSKAQAEAAFVQAEADVAKLEVAKTSKVAAAAQAQIVVWQAESVAQVAEADEETIKVEVAAAKTVLETKTIIAAREATEAAAFSMEEEVANRVVEIATADVIRMNNKATMNAEEVADREYALAVARTLAAERQAEAAAKMAEDAAVRVDTMEDRLEVAKEAKDEAWEKVDDAKVAFGDAQAELKDVEQELVLFRAELVQAQAAMIEAEQEPDLSKRCWATAEVESNYYTWRDQQGHSGYQLYQPYTVNYVNKHMEYSLGTGYVISENKSATDGRVATWTDTVLGLAYSQQQHKDMIVYRFDMNIPTGKGTLNGADAIMSDDLVEMSRFGEGWNYTTGISVSRKIGDEDTWTLGTSYTFRGRYTYDGSFADGWMEPGNVWVKDLRWQHAGQKWQLVAEISHTSAGTTQDGNITYRQGDQFDWKLTYNRGLGKDKNLMAYYWYTQEKPYTSADPLVTAGTTKTMQHIGVLWSKNWAAKRTLRIGVDMMKRDGNSYDPLTQLTSNERTKYAWGVGYDFTIATNRKVSIDIKQFYIKDDVPSLNNGYHGCNVYLRYSYTM